jgi:hypothetical protein
MNRKRRALRRSKTLGLDSEAQAATRPSRLARLVRKLKYPFTRQFWEDRFESSDDETLVDGRVLCYSYLEVGVIETIASYVSLCCTVRATNTQLLGCWDTFLSFTGKAFRRMISERHKKMAVD